MLFFRYFLVIFRLSPILFLVNFFTIVLQATIETLSLASLTPLVDYFLHGQTAGISNITTKFSNVLKFLGMDPSLKVFVGIFIGLTVLKAVSSLFFRYISLRTKYFFLRQLMVGSYSSFFNGGMPFFNSEKQGVLINTFNNEISSVGNSLITISVFLSNFIRVLFFIIIPFSISWQVTLIAGFVFGLVILPSKLADKISYSGGRRNVETANVLNIALQESLTAIKVILAFGNKEKAKKYYSESFEAHRKVTIPFQMIGSVLNAIFEPMFIAVLFLLLYIAQTFYKLPFSEVVVMLYAFRSIVPILIAIVVDKNLIFGFIPSYEQIERLQTKANQMTAPNGFIKFEKLKSLISLEDVSFQYGSKTILNHLNLEIKKGEKIAFVGKSGAGKTTIVDLILGLYKVDSGKVLVDGLDIKDLEIESFRKCIGYVPQDPILFNRSLRENLLWANETQSDEEIMNICTLAGAGEFVNHLSHGLDTLMGERGTKLSGGERQRIALARALSRKPELLILDEATSALDSHSEKLIQEAIDNLDQETTVIIIAHRLSTIRKSDRIFVIDAGKVIESGSYESLVAQKGFFSQLASQLS